MTESRTVSIDPGLLSPEELLTRHQGGRRRTLEGLIGKHQHSFEEGYAIRHRCREYVRWFLDSARLKISVRFTRCCAKFFNRNLTASLL